MQENKKKKYIPIIEINGKTYIYSNSIFYEFIIKNKLINFIHNTNIINLEEKLAKSFFSKFLDECILKDVSKCFKSEEISNFSYKIFDSEHIENINIFINSIEVKKPSEEEIKKSFYFNIEPKFMFEIKLNKHGFIILEK